LSQPAGEVRSRPLLRLNPGEGRRLKAGHPWAYSNEIAMRPEHREIPPGTLVRLEGDDGRPFGTFYFNPHSLIAARRLDADPEAGIDASWMSGRLAASAALRAKVADTPYHRLVHAEADRLPGLIVDRYDDVAVVQANAAGMDRLLPEILAGLLEVRPWRAVVARNDAPVRRLEGLPEEVRLLHGTDAAGVVVEGGVVFPIDPVSGQKTGWYFDQRPHRDRVAALAAGARVLDVFCHTGAFGLRCAAAGAAHVTLVDASGPALDRAKEAAERNGLFSRLALRRGDGFEIMAELGAWGERFEIVVCDPPAFVKARKDLGAGLRAYGRMARLAAPLVAPGGFLFLASCSHNVPAAEFGAAVADGLHRAGREGRIVHAGGAGPDHPVHPHLPESAYLKVELLHLT
jgi:23S rRNA (cytosine1962-C5)-methyltransferase